MQKSRGDLKTRGRKVRVDDRELAELQIAPEEERQNQEMLRSRIRKKKTYVKKSDKNGVSATNAMKFSDTIKNSSDLGSDLTRLVGRKDSLFTLAVQCCQFNMNTVARSGEKNIIKQVLAFFDEEKQTGQYLFPINQAAKKAAAITGLDHVPNLTKPLREIPKGEGFDRCCGLSLAVAQWLERSVGRTGGPEFDPRRGSEFFSINNQLFYKRQSARQFFVLHSSGVEGKMYTNTEYADMHLVYGAAEGDALASRRRYSELFPRLQLPSHQTFAGVDRRMREYGIRSAPRTGRPLEGGLMTVLLYFYFLLIMIEEPAAFNDETQIKVSRKKLMHKARVSGNSYVTGSGKHIPENPLPSKQARCCHVSLVEEIRWHRVYCVQSTDFVTFKKKMVIWSYNCCGQFKNRMMIFLYLYLIAMGIIDKMEHKFLMVGHSFGSADRDFVLIEQCWKVTSNNQILEHVAIAIEELIPSTPFRTFLMGGKFFDIDEPASLTINTSKLKISKTTWIMIEKLAPGVVEIRESFNEISDFKSYKVLKPGVTLENIAKIQIQALPATAALSAMKKENLQKMLPYIDQENREFFLHLFA
ncbi:hypothetical protein ANN_01410 [Periplaneta americana]|uniref:DUF7869 domain-containing protein n=1 Tax=Periplaneta americana TaxID=6978 RepID=A0ABQ8TVX7_PERAM|nr:hypothetical protein ANN_01410 [Periplaneta americana]